MIQLTPRERRLAIGAALFIAAWALYGFTVKPTLDRLETLNRVIPEKHAVLAELTAKSREYTALRRRLTRLGQEIASEPGDFALPAFLEESAENCGISDHVVSMQSEPPRSKATYVETLVTVKIENLTLNQLVKFLTAIQSGPAFVRIKSLTIQKNGVSHNRLDCQISISNLTAVSAT